MAKARCSNASAASPRYALAVALDLHGNVTPKMVTHADVIVSFKTYPHIDMYETGEHAGRLLLARLQGNRAAPGLAPGAGAVGHADQQYFGLGHAARVEAAKAAEQEAGVLAVSVLAGFPLSDFRDAGMSVVVVAENDAALADAVAGRIARQIWNERDDFVYDSLPLANRWRRQALERSAGRVRCCCWTIATTSCRAAPATPWTCWKRRCGGPGRALPWAR
jgi:microcystin degradation protein MlrC